MFGELCHLPHNSFPVEEMWDHVNSVASAHVFCKGGRVTTVHDVVVKVLDVGDDNLSLPLW